MYIEQYTKYRLQFQTTLFRADSDRSLCILNSPLIALFRIRHMAKETSKLTIQPVVYIGYR